MSKHDYLKDSKVKDVLYHGTMHDNDHGKVRNQMLSDGGIREFRPGDHSLLFATPDKDFANSYAYAGDKTTAYPAAVYPMHVHAKNPFDYENEDHRENLIDKMLPVKEGTHEEYDNRQDMRRRLQSGDWGYIERPDVLDAAKQLGHDAMFMKEGGAKNIGVFNPNQFKSAIGNNGNYDMSNPDITKAKGGKVSVDKMKRELEKQRFLERSHVQHPVYHGTTGDFSEFDPAMQGKNIVGHHGGFFFAKNKELTNNYAKGEGSNVIPSYVSIKNPSSSYDEFVKDPNYDGYHNSKIAVVRHPHQIKSAIGNNGNYDPMNPDITKAKGGTVVKYPMAKHGTWYGDEDYQKRGGVLRNVSPSDYLNSVRPLNIDDMSRENIDFLKEHIQSGGELDPLARYADGKEDGRHRAHAAQELGIKQVPVLDFGNHFVKKTNGGKVSIAEMKAALSAKMKPSPVRKATGGDINEGVGHDTTQEGAFYRVRPRHIAKGLARPQGILEGSGQDPEITKGSPRDTSTEPYSDEQIQGLIKSGNTFAHQAAQNYNNKYLGYPHQAIPNLPSSHQKQNPIGKAFELAASEHPEYQRRVYEEYKKHLPEHVGEAKDYKELLDKAYNKLGEETHAQFNSLPVNMSFHRNGEGNYSSSKQMANDVHNNRHLYVYQGGDPHEHLNKIDPETGLSQNDMFRAVHDFYGHAMNGSQFGPHGEEKAWAEHSGMFSPLARAALTSETRGQNSMVNYTGLNAELKKAVEAQREAQAEAKRRGMNEQADKHGKNIKDLMEHFKFAPKKSVLLPPEMLSGQYNGNIPHYLRDLIKPEEK